MTTSVTRNDLQQLKGISPKLTRFFEDLFSDGQATASSVGDAVVATGSIQNATVLSLSPNNAFNNERVFTPSTLDFRVTDNGPGSTLVVELVNRITLNGSFPLTFNMAAATNVDMPSEGTLATLDLGAVFADDAAAAAGGVLVGEMYKKTGGVVAWRVT